MAISFNTAATLPSTQTASNTLTIPAGVLNGDVMILCFEGFSSGVSPALTVTSTGTAFTQIGTTQAGGTGSGFTSYGGIYYAVASSTDAGKIITMSVSGGGTVFIAAAFVAYTGASNAAPIDVSGGTSGATSPLTVPSKVTTVASDWAVYAVAFGESPGNLLTAPGGITQRAKTEVNGVGAGIWDSAASVGAAGTTIGGISFTSSATTLWLTGFTVGLAPPHGAAHNDTAALTLSDTRSNTQVHGHNPAAALAVTPGRANVVAYGKNPKLVLAPVLTATPSGGSQRKGGPDRHRWWKP